MFQHGSSEVPAKVQERSRKFPAQITQCSRKVPATFQHRFQEGSRKVPGRFQHSSTIFQRRSSKFAASSSKVPATFKQGACKVARKVPSKVPGRFQQGSRAVPVFRACIFMAQIPGARDYNPTDSLLGINTDLNSYGSCPLFVASISGRTRTIYITDSLLVPPLGTLPEATYWGPGAKIQFSMQTSR